MIGNRQVWEGLPSDIQRILEGEGAGHGLGGIIGLFSEKVGPVVDLKALSGGTAERKGFE